MVIGTIELPQPSLAMSIVTTVVSYGLSIGALLLLARLM
jgi:hypothetical protein